ncbi:MAG: amidohydrolase family protein [Clostridia bacterium]|nr:amidohydrolase family protein [Clostridia bacterium]
MEKKIFALKGNICFSRDKHDIETIPNGYVVCENGICQGTFSKLPERYQETPCLDYGDQLIIPGLVDLHVHAPQYPFRGLAMDLELIDWLNIHTFPEEQKYADLEYAERAYTIFTDDLMHSATTRACIFATLHTPATMLLMDKLEQTGMQVYVGKVNMDRNSPPYLCEKSAAQAAQNTEQWLLACAGRYKNVKPILTPRFIPSCSNELMKQLAKLQKKYHLPMQSHLSENLDEIAWVQELCPETQFYGEAYDNFGLFGQDCPTIMAHCVYSVPEEIERMKHHKVFIAHCPQSNAALASGIAPVRQYIDQSLKVGLGSDIAAGFSLSIFRAMADTVQCSKLRWRLADQSLSPVKIEEAFYLGTKGGGEFFGKVGSFEPEYEFDAVVLNDTALRHPQELTIKERLERLIYLAEDRFITAKFSNGVCLFDNMK